LEAGLVKGLLRLYPRSWRKRYGAELEDLIDQTPGGVGVALDLVVGAAVAYRDVIAGNRILAGAGACLHGMCVAVLVQAIGFVTLILVVHRGEDPTDLRFGPFDFATVVHTSYFRLGEVQSPVTLLPSIYQSWMPDAALLLALGLALTVVLAAPRLLRRLG
jgi:hypothetical protein